MNFEQTKTYILFFVLKSKKQYKDKALYNI